MVSWKTDAAEWLWLTLCDWLAEWVFECLRVYPNAWLSVSVLELISWITGSLCDWMTLYVTKRMSDGISDWPPEWMSPWKKQLAWTTVASQSRWPRGLRRRFAAARLRDRGCESCWVHGLRIIAVSVAVTERWVSVHLAFSCVCV